MCEHGFHKSCGHLIAVSHHTKLLAGAAFSGTLACPSSAQHCNHTALDCMIPPSLSVTSIKSCNLMHACSPHSLMKTWAMRVSMIQSGTHIDIGRVQFLKRCATVAQLHACMQPSLLDEDLGHEGVHEALREPHRQGPVLEALRYYCVSCPRLLACEGTHHTPAQALSPQPSAIYSLMEVTI